MALVQSPDKKLCSQCGSEETSLLARFGPDGIEMLCDGCYYGHERYGTPDPKSTVDADGDVILNLLEDIKEMHYIKEHDYSGGRESYDNYRRAARLGVKPHLSVMCRIEEKVGRMETWASSGVLYNESIEDTLKDIALQALIALALLREDHV